MHDYKMQKINIKRFLIELTKNVSNINNYNGLKKFFIKNYFDVDVVRGQYHNYEDDDETFNNYFLAPFQLEDGFDGRLCVFWKNQLVVKVDVYINLSSDNLFWKWLFLKRKFNGKYNSLLKDLIEELGNPICNRAFIPELMNVVSGHVWCKSISDNNLNIYLTNETNQIHFYFENIQPDNRMRSEFDFSLLHLNRVLDNFNKLVDFRPNDTILIERRDIIKNVIEEFTESSNKKVEDAMRGLLKKWNKKLHSNIIINKQENSPIYITGEEDRIYLRQGVIYINKDEIDEGYDIVDCTFHITSKEYKRMLFFDTPEEANKAGYKPSEHFVSKYK